MTGRVAESIQMAVESIDPIAAADLRVAAGGSMSLATAAAERGLTDHSAETKADLAMHSSAYQRQRKAEADDFERRMLSDMETKANDLALRRGANPDDFDKPFASHGWQAKAIAKNKQAWGIDQ